ncbi:hypothetical protein YPPY66_1691 [Yersinia pestis PY-66]|nr:hypothetical protein YpAngola_A1492 [Yersinia pestis Angola]EDR34468.1 hypothetical protein YPIP275_4784 [Yersinia pestis biovar Orientalis str. IP275]EDR40583.1 hypothetical protein YpF1991016_0414 [Yersinia pestis biovar Orientalis str. F1991016]EDR43503.1 hypothetical protein YpE1979001_2519 [Yersinia pestis biovar Antiqua str. E1979001]EDR51900.1 hypothetical protein YpB42003004_2284 [Yersinia pestis biovar Antiqua str. B42003004]EDR58209.1 hypothetical protein YpMG051020_0663 [Yersinia
MRIIIDCIVMIEIILLIFWAIKIKNRNHFSAVLSVYFSALDDNK